MKIYGWRTRASKDDVSVADKKYAEDGQGDAACHELHFTPNIDDDDDDDDDDEEEEEEEEDVNDDNVDKEEEEEEEEAKDEEEEVKEEEEEKGEEEAKEEEEIKYFFSEQQAKSKQILLKIEHIPDVHRHTVVIIFSSIHLLNIEI
ncbi:hypothetical protein ElyMa_003471700 [Elysia marginata]|uniref:Uncharacterized protein n=1 Tax=Elysia marginata TaxID=1093978 RepID=A0AAV4EBG9_9GAST|nr:hypothetical protein ElyMa_003471700 [Elysia marginata]